MKDGDLIACQRCDGKGFRYVENTYHVRGSLIASYGMVDVTHEECETCNSKGLVIVTRDKENATC
jgi:RecJ-like exonuclease